MQGIRYLDKLVEELARGKAMEKILRTRDAARRRLDTVAAASRTLEPRHG